MTYSLVDLCGSFMRTANGSQLTDELIRNFLAKTLASPVVLPTSGKTIFHQSVDERFNFLAEYGKTHGVDLKSIFGSLQSANLQQSGSLTASTRTVSSGTQEANNNPNKPQVSAESGRDVKAVFNTVSKLKLKLTSRLGKLAKTRGNLAESETSTRSGQRAVNNLERRITELQLELGQISTGTKLYEAELDESFWITASESMFFLGNELSVAELQVSAGENRRLQRLAQTKNVNCVLFFIQNLFIELEQSDSHTVDEFDAFLSYCLNANTRSPGGIDFLTEQELEKARAATLKQILKIERQREQELSELAKVLHQSQAQLVKLKSALVASTAKSDKYRAELESQGKEIKYLEAQVEEAESEYYLALGLRTSVVEVRRTVSNFRPKLSSLLLDSLPEGYTESYWQNGELMRTIVETAVSCQKLAKNQSKFCSICSPKRWGCSCSNYLEKMQNYLLSEFGIKVRDLHEGLTQGSRWSWGFFHLESSREMHKVLTEAFRADIRDFNELVLTIRASKVAEFHWTSLEQKEDLDLSQFEKLIRGCDFPALRMLSKQGIQASEHLGLAMFRSLMPNAVSSGLPPAQFASQNWKKFIKDEVRLGLAKYDLPTGSALAPGAEYDD